MEIHEYQIKVSLPKIEEKIRTAEFLRLIENRFWNLRITSLLLASNRAGSTKIQYKIILRKFFR
jgi:hypothetical protein